MSAAAGATRPDLHARTRAAVAGVLILVSVTAFGIGSGLLVPLMQSGDPAEVADSSSTVLTGVLLELLCGLLVVLIPAAVFPVLRRHAGGAAIAFAGLRAVEATIIMLAAVLMLTLLSLSQSGGQGAATVSDAVVSARLWTGDMVVIASVTSYLVFFWATLRTRLLPVWLSVWGLLGLVLLLVADVVEIAYGNAGVFYQLDLAEFGVETLAVIPAGLVELVLALWLITRGFSRAGLQGDGEPGVPALDLRPRSNV